MLKDIRETLNLSNDIPDDAILDRISYLFYYVNEMTKVNDISIEQIVVYNEIISIMTRKYDVENY